MRRRSSKVSGFGVFAGAEITELPAAGAFADGSGWASGSGAALAAGLTWGPGLASCPAAGAAGMIAAKPTRRHGSKLEVAGPGLGFIERIPSSNWTSFRRRWLPKAERACTDTKCECPGCQFGAAVFLPVPGMTCLRHAIASPYANRTKPVMAGMKNSGGRGFSNRFRSGRIPDSSECFSRRLARLRCSHSGANAGGRGRTAS